MSLNIPLVPTASPADLRALLAEQWVVGAFVNALFREGLEAGTARAYIQAVQHFATDMDGTPSPLHPSTTLLLKGFSATGPPLSPKRPAITSALLLRMVAALPAFSSSADEILMLTAVFTLAFHGCFRASEYLKTSDPGKLLRVCDVSLTAQAGSLTITLKKTKTRQRAQSEQVVLPSKPGSPICPVAALAAYMSRRPRSLGQTGPLFHSFRRHKAYQPDHLNSDLKHLMFFMGIPNPESYTSHGFRIGAASEAAANGASMSQLQALGRWRSPAALDYVERAHAEAIGTQVRASMLGPHP